MDWNEGAGDTSIDDIFNFNTNTQGESKKKRSSILKKTNIDFFENDETAGTDYRRNRLGMKRVSFAETFQVKEFNTGNIYDIPGWNESSLRSQISSQSISVAESEIDKFEGNSTSRLSVPESATVTHQEPPEISRSLNQTSQNDKLDDPVDPFRSDGKDFTAQPSYGILDKSCLQIQFEKEFPVPSIASKAVRELLEGNSDDMELTMQERESVSIYPKPYGRNEENYEMEQNVVYSSVSHWMGGKNTKEMPGISCGNDFLKESFFKGDSQEGRSKVEAQLPFVMKSDKFAAGKNPQRKIPFSSNVNQSNKNVCHSKEIARSREIDVDILNKENQFQSSPKFQNLKFIDSPPSWKSDMENALNKIPKTSFENQPNPLEDIGFPSQNKVMKGPDVVLLQGQRKGLDFPREVDKENVYSGTEEKVETDHRLLKVATRVHTSSPCEDAKEIEMNKTRHNVSAMDLTLLQERLDEDSDTSHGPELHRHVDPEQNFEDCALASDRNAEEVEASAEKTQNKTRFSTCDMEITCMVDNPMDETSLFPSPSSLGNVCGDGTEKYVAGTKENINLNVFEVTELAPHERLKSSQESNPNFSFEEMGENTPFPSSNLFCPRSVTDESKYVYSNDSVLEKDCESALVNFSLGSKSQHFEAHGSGMVEDGTFKRKEQICRPPDGERGRKFLKFSDELPSSRLQTRSPNKESTLESSFVLKNKENLHACRKRRFQSANKPTRMPLVFRTDELEMYSNESVSQRIDISKVVSTSSEEGALIEHSVPFKDPCSSEISGISKQTRLFQSEMMELTCHNSMLEEKDESKEFLSPMVKQVQIVTETKISTPNVVFSTRKYENTRYSVSNCMDLTCLPDSENSPNTLGSFHEAGTEKNKFASDEVELTSNFMTKSQCNTNFSMDGSAFKRVERSSESIPSRQWSLTYRSSSSDTSLVGDENDQQLTSQPMELTTNFIEQSLFVTAEDGNSIVKESGQLLLHSQCPSVNTDAKYENKTQYFASQPMELTCKTSNFGNENLFAETLKADDSLIREHQVPPYFHLKILPASDSASKDAFRFEADRSVNARLFKVTTDHFSSSKPSSCSRKPETEGKTTPAGKGASCSGFRISPMNKTSVKDKSVTAVLRKDVNVRVNKAIESIERTNKEIGHKTFCAESVKGAISNLKMIQKKPPTSTPGAVYNIRKIKQALKEGASNLVLFPELGKVLKKAQRFNSKHPYSEMKIISPETKDYRKNISFDPSSQENTFTCSPREGSRLPSIGQLTSRLRDLSEGHEMLPVPIDAGVKTFSQDIESSIVIVASPEKPQTINVTKGDRSAISPEKHQGSNESSVCHSISYNQVPSIVCEDDSMQLLPHSALENTYLEAASKNYTICLDRSDFVLKERCSSAAEEPRQPSTSFQSANSTSQGASVEEATSRLQEKLEENYSSARNDAAALGRKGMSASPKDNESVLTKETQLKDFRMRRGSSSPAAVSFTLSSLREYYAARLRENDLSFPIPSFTCEDTVKNSQSSVVRLDSPQKSQSLEDCATQENMPPSKMVRAVSVASPILASENVDESFNGQKEPLNPQEDDLCICGERDVDVEAEVSSDERQGNFAAMDISNELQKLEVKNSSGDLEARSGDSSQALEKEILSEEIVTENKVVLTNKVSKSEDYRKDYGGNSSDCGVIPALQSNLDSLKEKLNKASEGEGVNWKLQTLCENSATFELKWAVYVYKCVLQVDVKSINATESSISFVPAGENLRNSVVNSVFDDVQDRGYKYFQYLVTDTVLPFTIFSEKLIDKLSYYSRISNTVEILMRDLLSFALGGECDIPYELDPLKITFQGINTNYECMYNMTFYVNLKTYPHEKIIPEVQHVLCKDITKEVLIAVNNEQPGPNYLFRMMDAARELKP